MIYVSQENMNASSKKLVEDQEKKVEEFNVKIKLLEEKLKSEKVSSLKCKCKSNFLEYIF